MTLHSPSAFCTISRPHPLQAYSTASADAAAGPQLLLILGLMTFCESRLMKPSFYISTIFPPQPTVKKNLVGLAAQLPPRVRVRVPTYPTAR